jgi:HTH-type transcriptional regulator / antitoxin HipB
MANEFSVRTTDQLPRLLQAFRKEAGLSQAEVALRMGISQQTFSALERNADRVSAGRLLKLLGVLGVDLVLRKPAPQPEQALRDPAGRPLW